MKQKQKGIALVSVMLALVLVVGLITVLSSRSLVQLRSTGDSVAMASATLASYSGQSMVTTMLNGPIRTNLAAVVSNTSNNANRWSYGTGTGSVPDADSVNTALGTVKTALQQSADTLVCGSNPSMGTGTTAQIRVYFTNRACNTDLPAGYSLPPARFVEGTPRGGGAANTQTYGVPYLIVVQGKVGTASRQTTLQGEYRFQVGRVAFARYALFTNVHRGSADPNAAAIYFTSRTLFDGPVHTNGRYVFTQSPYFGGEVTSAGCNDAACTSRRPSVFVTRAGSTVLDEQVNPTAASSFAGGNNSPNCINRAVCPQLQQGIDFGASNIPLPTNNLQQQNAAANGGISIGYDSNLRIWAANSNGDPLATGQTAASQYIQSCRASAPTTCETWRVTKVNGQMVMQKNSSTGPTANGTWAAATPFNGVIFAPAIKRLAGPERTNAADPRTAPPAVASFAQLTIAATGDVRITRDLKYETPPCSRPLQRNTSGVVEPAVCDKLDADNILGVYSQDGNVLIGTSNTSADHAPRDITIHATLMSSGQAVTVERYNDNAYGDRGSANILGGVIENFYGPFGTFNGNTPTSGFGRAFTFDPRMGQGMSPPYFPTAGLDQVNAVFVRSYGIREQ